MADTRKQGGESVPERAPNNITPKTWHDQCVIFGATPVMVSTLVKDGRNGHDCTQSAEGMHAIVENKRKGNRCLVTEHPGLEEIKTRQVKQHEQTIGGQQQQQTKQQQQQQQQQQR